MMNIIWREHAQWRMAERRIEPDTVRAALTRGEVIRHYADDDSCGERYFDDEITRQLLAMVKNTLKPGVNLDIRQYQEAA